MNKKDHMPLDAVNVLAGNSVALRSGDDQEKRELPKRVKIFEWGENNGRTTGARIVVGAKTLQMLTANQETMARDTVPMDYEHQSFEGHPKYKEPPHHVAAHGRIEVVEGEGVYFSSISYTPNGEEYATNYPDVSPVAYTDDEDNLIFIHSVALTHSGDVANLAFAEALSALSASSNKPKPKTPTMDDDKKDKYREMLVELLGLKPGEGEDQVSDEAIAAAVADMAKAMSTKPETDKTPDSDNVAALSARLDQMERDRLVDRATAEGKVIPLSAEQIKETSVATLSAMISKLPAGEVHTTQKTTPEKPGKDPVALSADDKKLCQRLGITEEEFQTQR